MAELKIVKGDYPKNYFTKKLSNGHRVIDYDKFEETEFNFFLFMTERGSKGKTMGAKEHARKKFLETGLPSMYIMNTNNLIKKSKKDFFKDINKINTRREIGEDAYEFYEKTKWKGSADDTTLELISKHRDFKNPQTFFKFLKMSDAELMKGSRAGWDSIYYDEFNVKQEVLRKPVELFDSLLHSIEDIVFKTSRDIRLYLFGNSKTLDVEILWKLGVTHTTEGDVTKVYTADGRPLMLIYSPDFDEKEQAQIKKENRNNWIFTVSEQLGTAEHAYFNKSLQDSNNNILRYKTNKELAEMLNPEYCVHHNGDFYNMYRNTVNGTWHVNKVNFNQVIKLKDGTPKMVILNKRNAIEDGVLRTNFKDDFITLLKKSLITFEDISSRMLFIKSIRN